MSNHLETFKHNGWEVSLFHPVDIIDPRKDYDHLGTMVWEHRRYSSPDNEATDDARHAVQMSKSYRPSWDEKYDLFNPGQLWQAIQECKDIVSLPIYMYDHGGQTINTTGFSCAWDSGQLGFIFLTADKARKEAIIGGKNLSPKRRAKIEEILKSEVKEYDQYMTGEVYHVVVHTPGDQDDEKADLYGVYGLDYAREEGKRMADELEPYVADQEAA